MTQHMPFVVALACGAAVVACGATSARAHGFESILTLLDNMVEAPYECADYDPASDTCSAVSLMYSEEGIIYNTAWFALPNPGGTPWVFETFSEYEFLLGWGCPLPRDGGPSVRYSSGGTPELGETYARQIQAQLAESLGAFEPCAGYFPTGFRQYEVEFRYPNGERAERANISVHFFPEPKAIRP